MKKAFLFIAFLSITLPGFLHAQAPASTRPIKVPILIYHSVRPYYPGITKLVKEFTVPPDIFDDQLKYLRDNGFTPVTLDGLVAYFNSGTALQQRPVIITLDDGWQNQFRYAFPILKKYNDPAVFYIYSSAIGKKHFLTWDEVKALVNANMIIGGHTKTHPELPKITDQQVLNEEIVNSKKIIEANIGKIINDFAYPFGEYNDHNVDVVMRAGYKSARTVRQGTYQTSDILFTLRGIIVTGDFNRFAALVNE